MEAKYIKKEIADLNGMGSTQAYYRMKTTPMSHEEFVSMCEREGHIPEGTVNHVLELVSSKLALSMAEGKSVKISGIGTFYAQLGLRGDALQDAFELGESTRNAKSIQVTGVAYRADEELVVKTQGKCHLVRGGVSRLKKSKYSYEERIELARQFLEKKPLMRVADYATLTGLSKTTASKELLKVVKDPDSGITSIGKRSQKFYTLRRP